MSRYSDPQPHRQNSSKNFNSRYSGFRDNLITENRNRHLSHNRMTSPYDSGYHHPSNNADPYGRHHPSHSNSKYHHNINSNSSGIRRICQRMIYKITRIRLPMILLLLLLTVPIILLIDPTVLDLILEPLDLIAGKSGLSGTFKSLTGRTVGTKHSKPNLEKQVAPRKILGKQENATLLTPGHNFNHNIVVYNRAPKCGSIYMTRLLYLLGAGNRNQYKVQSPYEEGEKPFLSDDQQKTVVGQILTAAENEPLVYIRHQYFIDFKQFDEIRPIYLNIIRDPLKRFESFYYFIRFGNKEGDGADVAMSNARLHMSIDECVQARDRECTEPKWQLVPYFCGHDVRCRNRSGWAVDRAKENIDKYFTFVGILEELDGSLEVLEYILPRYFKDAREVKHEPSSIKNDTFTLHKNPPSAASKEFLRTQTSIHLEYELYYYVKERYHSIRKKLLLEN